jgi:hypothetical protein
MLNENLLERSGNKRHFAGENSGTLESPEKTSTEINTTKLEQFTGRVLEDLAATFSYEVAIKR